MNCLKYILHFHNKRFQKMCAWYLSYNLTTCKYILTVTKIQFYFFEELFFQGSPRLDVNTTFSLHYQENIDEYVVLKVPLISYPKPKDATWFGPRREQFQLDAASTISQGDKPYQFWIHSEIHIINKSSFGYYKLFVEGEEILTILIENKGKPKFIYIYILLMIENDSLILWILSLHL